MSKKFPLKTRQYFASPWRKDPYLYALQYNRESKAEITVIAIKLNIRWICC